MNAHRAPKPALLSQVPKGVSMVVEASAGTGKTYTLVHWIVDLLLREEVTLDQILVLTFTVKAAGELRERVRSLLRELLRDPKIAQDDEPAFVLDDVAREKLTRAEQTLDAATITTIHSFCQSVLAETGFFSGRLLSEETTATRPLAERTFKEILRSHVLPDPLLQALYFAAGTPDMVERAAIAALAQRSRLVPAWEEARFTAALERVARVPGDKLRKKSRIQNAVFDLTETASLDLPPQKRAIEAHARLKKLAQKSDEGGGSGAEAEAWAAVEALAEVTPSPRVALLEAVMPLLRERVDAEKRARGLLDFDDMLLAVEASLRGPQGPEVIARLRGRYKFALIDEFQDTDAVQWFIFERIFVESPGPHPAYLIGDPKQAIYSFRGADIGTYLTARRRILAKARPLALTSCFRATPRLIGTYNRIFARPEFFGSGLSYTPVCAGRESLRLVDADGREAAPVVALDAREIEKKDDDAIAAAIAEELDRILYRAPLRFGDAGAERPIAPSDVYVLVRSRAGAATVANALRARRIPYTFYRQTGLYQSDEADEMLALLEAIADPDDEGKRGAAYLTRFFGVPLGALETLSEQTESKLRHTLLELHRVARERKYDELFSRMLYETGVLRREIALAAGERGLTNFLHLAEVLQAEALRTRGTVEDLVEFLRNRTGADRTDLGEEDEQRLETDKDAVQLLTMHVSKGLEAKVVFVTGVPKQPNRSDALRVVHLPSGERCLTHDPVLPELRDLLDEEQRDEERRLLYVAITRAKGRLYLPVYAKPSESYAAVQEALEEHRDEADEHGPLVEHRPVKPRGGPSTDARSGADDALDTGPSLTTFTLRDPSLAAGEAVDYRALAKAHEALRVTSYTGLKRYAAEREAPLAPEARRPDDEAPAARPPADDELPGGAEAGVLVHGVLENVDVRAVAEAPSFEAWAARDDVRALIDASLERHRMPRRAHGHVARMVHAALTTKLVPGDGPRSLATAERLARETELVYPIPEATFPPFGVTDATLPGPGTGTGPDAGLRVERGYVKGILDVVAVLGGKVYFADYKTDVLTRYDEATVTARVDETYRLQIKLYTLGLLRLFGITDEATYEATFGGYFYLFVRGLAAGETSAAHHGRPTFADAQRWERELREEKNPYRWSTLP